MGLDLSDYETARAINDYVRKAVADELSKQRPQARYATVVSINESDRSCLVIYIGEDVAVRVPYTNVKPANPGQEVRIEGAPGDRTITAVRGTSAAEQRADNLETAGLSLKLTAIGYSINGGPAQAPFTLKVHPAYGKMPDGTDVITVDATGIVTVNENGYYDLSAQFSLGAGTSTSTLWIQCLPFSGAENYDITLASSGGGGDTGQPLALAARTLAYLYAGDRLRVNIYSAVNRTVDQNGSRFVIRLDHRYTQPQVNPVQQ